MRTSAYITWPAAIPDLGLTREITAPAPCRRLPGTPPRSATPAGSLRSPARGPAGSAGKRSRNRPAGIAPDERRLLFRHQRRPAGSSRVKQRARTAPDPFTGPRPASAISAATALRGAGPGSRVSGRKKTSLHLAARPIRPQPRSRSPAVRTITTSRLAAPAGQRGHVRHAAGLSRRMRRRITSRTCGYSLPAPVADSNRLLAFCKVFPASLTGLAVSCELDGFTEPGKDCHGDSR
jgi:hypothetical protein